MNASILCKKGIKGFSLIELLIAVAIMGILASLAYPSYLDYLNRARRADGLSTLSQIQLILERCYSQNFSYNAACTSLPAFPSNSPQGFYAISIANLGASTYTLTATAQGNQIRDSTCATMSVNQANVKTAFDTGGAAQASCWNP